MTLTILSLVILAQVIVFQFVYTLGIRSLLKEELNAVQGSAFDQVREYTQKAPRFRLWLGVILAGWVVLCALGLLFDPGASKWILVGVSIVSAVAFSVACNRDRKLMRHFVDLLPGGGVRRASLERRSLGLWYHPLLEAIPVAILLATALFLFFGAGDGVETQVPSKSLWYLGVQGAFVIGALYYSFRRGTGVSSVVMRLPSLRQRPGAAMVLSESLAATEMRFFVVAKICVTLLLGAGAIESMYEALHLDAASLWDGIGWGLVGLMLVVFFLYLRRIASLSKAMKHEIDSVRHEVVG